MNANSNPLPFTDNHPTLQGGYFLYRKIKRNNAKIEQDVSFQLYELINCVRYDMFSGKMPRFLFFCDAEYKIKATASVTDKEQKKRTMTFSGNLKK